MEKHLLFSRTVALKLLFIGIVLFNGIKSNAQESITSLGSPVAHDFNSMGSSATATLPAGFRINSARDWTTGTSATTQAYGSTGTGAVTTSSAGGAVNWANGVTASSAERAVGFLTSNSYTSPRSIVYAFTNNTGSTVTSLAISFNYEKYRSGTRAIDWTFYHGSTAGSVATADVAGNHSYASDANNGVISNPPLSVNKSFEINGLTIATGTTYYLAWSYTGVSGSTNSQGLAVDDFAITLSAGAPAPDVSVSTPSLSFGSLDVSGQSASQSFNLSGSNLTGFPSDITVNAPNSNFEVSNDNATWGSSTTVAYTSATLAATPVYVRFTPQSGGAQSGNVTVSGGGDTTTPTVALSGNGTLVVPVTALPTNIGQSQFDANWDGVAGATGYLLDVSTSPIFGTSGVAFTESFTSTTFPPTGWIQTNWTRSTTTADYNTAPAASIGGSSTGSLTTAAVSNPISMTFYLGRSSNTTAKTLTVEVSTTSQASGFTTVATYDHSNVPESSYNQYTVNLSAYSSYPTVYIRFVKASSTTSPWRLDDIVVNHSIPSFVTGYNALPVTGTSHTVSGLSPLTNYYYRLRATAGSETSGNSNVQAVNTLPEVITWNGTAWSNTVGPDTTKEAEIQGVYNTVPNGEFTALKLTITSGSLTIANGTSVTVVNEVVNNLTAADFVIESNAGLVQINNIENTGSATVKRDSAPLMRLDYTLWSSPVSAQILLDFSPLTVPTRFYTYNPSTDQYNTVGSPSTTTFADAIGYLIRMPDNHPTTATVWNGTFTGTPHNGNYVLTVANNTYNAVGNPYPSVIDADEFINGNGITEALYFWRKANSATSAYATYTLAGGVGTSSSSGDPLALVPNGFIQTGQGFIVRSVSTTITFNNDMRVYNYDNQFLRANIAERHRIWLNLTNPGGLFSQAMVAYMEGASNGIDAAVDGRYFNDSQNALTSIVNNEEFAVQGRSLPFTTADVVPLGFKTEVAGNFTISLDHVDGLFAEGQQVYLRDNLTGNVHDLAAGGYDFAAEAGVFNSRFEIVYDSALAVGNPSATSGNVIAYKQDGHLVVNSGNIIMDSVTIYDVSGRLLLFESSINSNEVVLAPAASHGLLLIEVKTLENGKVVKKIMY